MRQLKAGRQPAQRLLVAVGSAVSILHRLTDSGGVTRAYAAELSPDGFLLLSANDSIEPIIAFSPGSFSLNHPLVGIAVTDLMKRPRPTPLGNAAGNGGPYNWNEMPLNYDDIDTLAERKEIGALCSDIGIAMGASYSSDGTSSFMEIDTLKDVFQYGNAIHSYDGMALNDLLYNVLNPNLDAELPVVLSMKSAAGTYHAMVCDGYGYHDGTLYHHLNLGFYLHDENNIWYNLPDVPSTENDYNLLNKAYYNIFTSGSGEVVSGRVLDESGAPLDNIRITATATGQPVLTTRTNAKGIYGLKCLASILLDVNMSHPAHRSSRPLTVHRATSFLSVGPRFPEPLSTACTGPNMSIMLKSHSPTGAQRPRLMIRPPTPFPA